MNSLWRKAYRFAYIRSHHLAYSLNRSMEKEEPSRRFCFQKRLVGLLLLFVAQVCLLTEGHTVFTVFVDFLKTAVYKASG